MDTTKDINDMTADELMELHQQLTTIEDRAAQFKSAYLWDRQFGNEIARQQLSRKYSVPEVTWMDGGKEYTAEYYVSYSATKCYPHGYYYRDGKKTTLTSVKASHKRLAARLQGMMPEPSEGMPADELPL